MVNSYELGARTRKLIFYLLGASRGTGGVDRRRERRQECGVCALFGHMGLCDLCVTWAGGDPCPNILRHIICIHPLEFQPGGQILWPGAGVGKSRVRCLFIWRGSWVKSRGIAPRLRFGASVFFLFRDLHTTATYGPEALASQGRILPRLRFQVLILNHNDIVSHVTAHRSTNMCHCQIPRTHAHPHISKKKLLNYSYS